MSGGDRELFFKMERSQQSGKDNGLKFSNEITPLIHLAFS